MKKEWGKDLVYDLASAVLQAIGMHCFVEPCQIAPGGVSGVALLINYVSQAPIGLMTFLLNVPLLMLSYRYLGRMLTLKTLKTVAIMSIVLDVVIAPYVPAYVGDRLISCGFGGIFLGVGLALVFMRGSTTGGGDILAKLLQKRYPYMQTGHALLIIDFAVIAASVVVYRNLESALYGLISLVLTTYSIDFILYGMSRGTMIMVISKDNEKIAEAILNQLERGATFFKSQGAYTRQEGNVLVCVVERKQFYLVKAIIDEIDREAFVIVSETKEVYGEGFLNGRSRS